MNDSLHICRAAERTKNGNILLLLNILLPYNVCKFCLSHQDFFLPFSLLCAPGK